MTSRLTIVIGAAVLFTSLFANSFSLVIPEDETMGRSQGDDVALSSRESTTPVDDAIASNQVDDVVLSSPEPTTPVDDGIASNQVDDVALSSPKPTTPVDDPIASGQEDDVVQSSPEAETPVDDAVASGQEDDVVQSSPEAETPVDDAVASHQVDEIVESSPEPETPVDDAVASHQVDEIAESSPEPETPVDDAVASHQVDEIAESSPEPETPVDDAVASHQVDEIAESSPEPETPVDDAVASHQVDEIAETSPEPTTPAAESTSSQSNEATSPDDEQKSRINLVTSTVLPQTPIPKENAQTLKIDEIIKMVENRSAEVFRKLIDLGVQDTKAKSDLTIPYREKLGTHIQTLKSYVNGIIAAGEEENLYKYECLKYFDDYAMSLVDNTLKQIHDAFLEAYHNMSLSLGKFSIESKKTINRLIDLKEMALSDEAENVAEKTPSAIYEAYESSIGNFLKEFMIKADGPRIIEKMRPLIDQNIDLGLGIIEKTYNCVFSVL